MRDQKTKLIFCTTSTILVIIAVIFPFDDLARLLTVVSIPVVLFASLFSSFLRKDQRVVNWDLSLYVTYLWLAALILGILSLFFSFALLFPSALKPSYLDDYAYEIYLMLYSFAPILWLY